MDTRSALAYYADGSASIISWDRTQLEGVLSECAKKAGVALPAPMKKTILAALSSAAWIDIGVRDKKDGQMGGYEINFNPYFYKYRAAPSAGGDQG